MTLFLIIFLSLYGGMHCYIYFRFRQCFRINRLTAVTIFSWLLFMTLSPVLVRVCENRGWDQTAKLIAWPGYTWMGFIFILTTILLTLDTIRLAAHGLARNKAKAAPRILHPHITAEIALLLAIAITTYGYFDARNIRTNHVTIQTSKLPAASSGIRIVQVSDIHLGLIIREDRLKEMLQAVNDAKPDILISTGDLVDGRLSHQEGIKGYEKVAAMLANVKAPLGKFAVTGNHEFYAGLEQSLAVTRAAGFTILRNEYISLPGGLTISGVDDPAWKRMGLKPPAIDEATLLKSLPLGQFRLHLKHRPLVPNEFEGLFDLQLSGHTHHGQIFPFYLLTKIEFPIPSGTTSLKNGSTIHVSNGTGTWGPPIRFLAPPEVTVIDIIPVVKVSLLN